MNKQLLKTSGADVLSSRKKLRKTLWGVASTPPPPPPSCVRGLHNAALLDLLLLFFWIDFKILWLMMY